MDYSDETSHSPFPFTRAQCLLLMFDRDINTFQPFPCPLVHQKSSIRLNFEIIFGIYISLGINLKCFVYLCVSEPSFVNMEVVHESESNPDGDDDKIYVFFTETAVEFEFYDKLLVSRIARICRVGICSTKILFSVFQMKFHS